MNPNNTNNMDRVEQMKNFSEKVLGNINFVTIIEN